MLTVSDVPSFAKLGILDPLEGNGTGELALQKHIHHIRRLCKERHEDIYVHAATGSGKSRLLPDVLAESCRSSCNGMNFLSIFFIYCSVFSLNSRMIDQRIFAFWVFGVRRKCRKVVICVRVICRRSAFEFSSGFQCMEHH